MIEYIDEVETEFENSLTLCFRGSGFASQQLNYRNLVSISLHLESYYLLSKTGTRQLLFTEGIFLFLRQELGRYYLLSKTGTRKVFITF